MSRDESKPDFKVSVCLRAKKGRCRDQGACDVLERFQELVAAHGLDSSVRIKAVDCLGECGKGPVVKIKDRRDPDSVPGLNEKRKFKIKTRVEPEQAKTILEELLGRALRSREPKVSLSALAVSRAPKDRDACDRGANRSLSR